MQPEKMPEVIKTSFSIVDILDPTKFNGSRAVLRGGVTVQKNSGKWRVKALIRHAL